MAKMYTLNLRSQTQVAKGLHIIFFINCWQMYVGHIPFLFEKKLQKKTNNDLPYPFTLLEITVTPC